MEQDTYLGVTVPPVLLPNAWEAQWWKAGVDSALAARDEDLLWACSVENVQRAEKAEADRDEELGRLQITNRALNAAAIEALERAEKAETERDTLKSTLAAVRSLRDDWARGRAPGFARELTETLEQGPAKTHTATAGTEEKETP